MNYNLINYDGYPLIEIDGGIYLIDTGAPSMCFSNKKTVNINGNIFNLNPAFGVRILTESEMFKTFGRVIDGFIGIDIIRKFQIIEIDKINNKVSFGVSHKPRTNETKMSNFQVKLKVNNFIVNGYLDTGAHILMVENHSILNKNNYIGQVEETSNNGPFVLDKYYGIMKIGDIEKEVLMLKKDPRMLGNRSDVYFGLDQISEEYYVIDLKTNTFYFK